MSPPPVPREAALIVNAHSRRGRELFREAKRLLEEAGITLTETHAVKNPRRLNSTVDEAVARGVPMVIVGGGDGSLSCTIDFVVGRNCVFALLPLGTANSFARTLGIPLDLQGAVETIATGKRRRIDLGKIDKDYFANCAAMGLSPLIGEGIPHRLKRYLGRLGYLIWAIWCLIRFRPFRLTVDDGKESRTIWSTEVRIANGRFHGGVELVERADVDSGELVVQAVVGRSKWGLLWNWLASMLKLQAREATVEHFHGRKLRIETRPRQKISIDGEVLAKTPVTAEVASCAVEVVVPDDRE
jgi:YegS/Rv2252/BmrU family lipid kinase